jgi:hypothetical protein
MYNFHAIEYVGCFENGDLKKRRPIDGSPSEFVLRKRIEDPSSQAWGGGGGLGRPDCT